MTEQTVTINRRDIRLDETFDPGYGMSHTWEVGVSGRLSTGEYVSMTRPGYQSHAEALAAIEAAIRDQGWEISDAG